MANNPDPKESPSQVAPPWKVFTAKELRQISPDEYRRAMASSRPPRVDSVAASLEATRVANRKTPRRVKRVAMASLVAMLTASYCALTE